MSHKIELDDTQVQICDPLSFIEMGGAEKVPRIIDLPNLYARYDASHSSKGP